MVDQRVGGRKKPMAEKPVVTLRLTTEENDFLEKMALVHRSYRNTIAKRLFSEKLAEEIESLRKQERDTQ